jgi:hypothetical protein
MTTIVRTVRCHGCRRYFDVATMIRGTGSTLYCTKICLAQETKTFCIPTPRRAA